MLDLAVVAAAIDNFMLNTSADATAQLHHGTPALFTLPDERPSAPAILAIKCWSIVATSVQSNLHTHDIALTSRWAGTDINLCIAFRGTVEGLPVKGDSMDHGCACTHHTTLH